MPVCVCVRVFLRSLLYTDHFDESLNTLMQLYTVWYNRCAHSHTHLKTHICNQAPIQFTDGTLRHCSSGYLSVLALEQKYLISSLAIKTHCIYFRLTEMTGTLNRSTFSIY